MRYIYLDVHKNNIAACVIANNGKPVKRISISDRSRMSEITEYMGNDEYCVMMESSTYVYDVYRYFESIGIDTYVAHAKGLKMITSSDNEERYK